MKIAIIGGGAAGFFAAIAAKENYPNSQVVLFEKTRKLLSKVKISGGGRCNVTNASTSKQVWLKAYPRGGKKLKKAFQVFDNQAIIRWFEMRDVPLYAQTDRRVFPVSQKSQSIIDCLLSECKRLSITIQIGRGVSALEAIAHKWRLHFFKTTDYTQIFDKVIIATGGSPKPTGLTWLEKLGHQVESPVPSLFTFNMPSEQITELMGISVTNALVRIQSTKLKAQGAVLITHWGMSGPAILELSAYGARILQEKNYQCQLQVNWTAEQNYDKVFVMFQNLMKQNSSKSLGNLRPFELPKRLWHFLCHKNNLSLQKKCNTLGKKSLQKLTTLLTNDCYEVRGKTTFKEEFVSCGGISLKSVNFKTMESKICKNLYFAGEVLDIDGITGGFNFQAAWTTAFIAGKLLDASNS